MPMTFLTPGSWASFFSYINSIPSNRNSLRFTEWRNPLGVSSIFVTCQLSDNYSLAPLNHNDPAKFHATYSCGKPASGNVCAFRRCNDDVVLQQNNATNVMWDLANYLALVCYRIPLIYSWFIYSYCWKLDSHCPFWLNVTNLLRFRPQCRVWLQALYCRSSKTSFLRFRRRHLCPACQSEAEQLSGEISHKWDLLADWFPRVSCKHNETEQGPYRDPEFWHSPACSLRAKRVTVV